MTCAQRLLGRHRNLLMKLIAANLGTYHLLASATLVTAYRITGERDHVPASELTATDWLCEFLGTEATHPQARTVNRDLSKEMSPNPNEVIMAVASRLTDALRA